MEDLLNQASRFIYPELRRGLPLITLLELARLASDGTEDLTKTRWQFSVIVRCASGKRHEALCHRVVIFWDKIDSGTYGGLFSCG